MSTFDPCVTVSYFNWKCRLRLDGAADNRAGVTITNCSTPEAAVAITGTKNEVGFWNI